MTTKRCNFKPPANSSEFNPLSDDDLMAIEGTLVGWAQGTPQRNVLDARVEGMASALLGLGSLEKASAAIGFIDLFVSRKKDYIGARLATKVAEAMESIDKHDADKVAFTDGLLAMLVDRACNFVNVMDLLALSLKCQSWKSVSNITNNMILADKVGALENLEVVPFGKIDRNLDETLVQYAAQLVGYTLKNINNGDTEVFNNQTMMALIDASENLNEARSRNIKSHGKVDAKRINNSLFKVTAAGAEFKNAALMLSLVSHSSDLVTLKIKKETPYSKGRGDTSLFSAACIDLLNSYMYLGRTVRSTDGVRSMTSAQLMSWAMLNNIAQRNADILSKEDTELFAVMSLAVSPCAPKGLNVRRIARALFDSTGGMASPENKVEALVNLAIKSKAVTSRYPSPEKTLTNDAISALWYNTVKALFVGINIDAPKPSGDLCESVSDTTLCGGDCHNEEEDGLRFPEKDVSAAREALLPALIPALPLSQDILSYPEFVKSMPREKWIPQFVDLFLEVGGGDIANNGIGRSKGITWDGAVHFDSDQWWDSKSLRGYFSYLQTRPTACLDTFVEKLKEVEKENDGVSLMFEKVMRQENIDSSVAVRRSSRPKKRSPSGRAPL